MPAQTKKYYSVKEAARLIGVSTNTIYTYLKENKLTARRYGQGRFKIPYDQLAPYFIEQVVSESKPVTSINPIITANTPLNVGNPGPQAPSVVAPVVSTKPVIIAAQVIAPINAEPLITGEAESIRSGINDRIFWRLFKGLAFLGLGVIYIFAGNNFYNFSDPFFGEIGNLLRMIMPYGLLLGGLLTLADSFYEEQLKPYDRFIHFVNSLILSYYAFISIASGEYLGFITLGSIAILMVIHLLTGVDHKGSFVDAFNKFTVITTLLGGILIIISPATYPLPYFTNYVEGHTALFALVWFGVITIPAIFFLTEGGKKLKGIIGLYYLLLSMLRLIYATRLGMEEIWDIAYLTYLMSVFGLFLVWWNYYKGSILQKKITSLSLSFVWVAVSILAGFLVVNEIRNSVKVQQDKILTSNLDKAKKDFGDVISEAQSVLLKSAGSPEMAGMIERGEAEEAILKAKEVYENTEFAKRVAVLNSTGEVIGFYPRESTIERDNLSSSDYFKETVIQNKGIVSNIFTTETGDKSFVATEPVYKDNQFIGMLAMSFDLQKLSLNAQNEFTENMTVYVVDEGGTYAFGSNMESIGQKYNAEKFLHKTIPTGQNIEKYYNTYQTTSANPKFTFYLYSPPPLLNSGLSYSNILFSAFVVVNAAFSLFAGLLISTKKNDTQYALANTGNNYGQTNLAIRQAI